MNQPDEPDMPPTATTLDKSARRRRELMWIFTLVFIFAIGAFIVLVQVSVLPASISAAGGHGQPGTATAADVDCGDGPGTCMWFGDYVSADHTLAFRDVAFEGGGWHVDRPVAALYEGQSILGDPLIFRADAPFVWVGDALFLAFGCGLMVLTLLLHVLAIRGVVKWSTA